MSRRNKDKFEKGNAEVELKRGESFNSLLKRFNKKVERYGFLDEYRERMYFTKPSDKKRREKQEQEYRYKKGITRG